MTQKDPTLGLPNGKSRFDASMPRSSQNDTTSSITGAAKEAASHLAKDAKEELSSRLTSQKDKAVEKAAEKLGTVADALRGTQDATQEVPFVGDYAKKAAEGVDRLSSYIQTRTLGQLVGDVETFARREPALFFGGAFTLGLLAGRFLKSSPVAGPSVDNSPTPRSLSISTTSPGPMPGSPSDGREDLP